MTAPEPWRTAAACRAFPTSWWFVVDEPEAVQAFLICGSCPVRGECLAAALEREEVYGIWAGTSPEERGRMRDRMRAARGTTGARD